MDIVSAPTDGHTLSVSAPATSNFTFSTPATVFTGSGSAGGTQTLGAAPSVPTGSPTTVTYDASTHSISASTTFR